MQRERDWRIDFFDPDDLKENKPRAERQPEDRTKLIEFILKNRRRTE